MIKSTTFMMEISLCAIIFRRARSVGWSELCSLITLFFNTLPQVMALFWMGGGRGRRNRKKPMLDRGTSRRPNGNPAFCSSFAPEYHREVSKFRI
jgi:hypothetical protein